jgi:hypothetical protein
MEKGWKFYESDPLGLSFFYPPEWLLESARGDTTIYLFPIHKIHQTVKPMFEITILYQDIPLPINAINMQTLKSFSRVQKFGDFKLSHQKLSGKNAVKVFFSSETEGVPTKHFYVWFVEGNKQYIIGFLSPSLEFELYTDILHDFLVTFKIDKPRPGICHLLYKHYISEKLGFCFRYPDGLEVFDRNETDIESEYVVKFKGNKITSIDQGIPINVELEVSILDLKNIKFETYVELRKIQISKILTYPYMLIVEDLSSKNFMYKMFKYTIPLERKKMRHIQYLVHINNLIYTFSISFDSPKYPNFIERMTEC